MANVKIIVKANGCLDSVLQRNGTQIKTIPSAATFDLITKLDGVVEDGTWDGIDTLDFTSNTSNLQINGVQSEVLSGGTTFNLIALLNGVSGGTYSAITNTLSFTTDPFPVRWDYISVSETQYIGFGYASTTDSDIITIKRNIRNPSTGVITTAYATDTWNNHLTATYN